MRRKPPPVLLKDDLVEVVLRVQLARDYDPREGVYVLPVDGLSYTRFLHRVLVKEVRRVRRQRRSR